MRIRTITCGLKAVAQLEEASGVLTRVKKVLEDAGQEVQSLRLVLPSHGLTDETSVRQLSEQAASLGIGFISLGSCHTHEQIDVALSALKSADNISFNIPVVQEGEIDEALVTRAASIMLDLSQNTPGGMGNFSFGATALCPVGIPFFPAAHHEGEPWFSLGLENGTVLHRAFLDAGNLKEGLQVFSQLMTDWLEELHAAVHGVDHGSLTFLGTDPSLNPSLDEGGSVVGAFEHLGMKLGDPGSFTLVAGLTQTLRGLKAKICGYRGLMLPVLEDKDLAHLLNEQKLRVPELLGYSALCACGYDTVPLSGDIELSRLEALIRDMASMALKLNKPLAARLFPAPGLAAGQMTRFESPHLVNARVLSA